MSYLSKAQVDKMLEPINPNRVGRNAKGFAHVEAYEIRATMNRLFGFARWSEEVVSQELVFETSQVLLKKNGKKEPIPGTEYDAWTVCYRSVVKLTVCAPDGTVLAVYTEGATGDSSNQPSRADAHDNALKTSQSQAFKRAAANLGDICGLSLWGKGSMRPIVYATLHYPFTDEQEGVRVATAVDAHIDAPQAPEDESAVPVVSGSQAATVEKLRADIEAVQARGRAS